MGRRQANKRLGVADAGGLHALLALLGDEGDGLALLKGLEAVLLLMKPYPFSSLNHLTVPFWRSEGAASDMLMDVCGGRVFVGGVEWY